MSTVDGFCGYCGWPVIWFEDGWVHGPRFDSFDHDPQMDSTAIGERP